MSYELLKVGMVSLFMSCSTNPIPGVTIDVSRGSYEESADDTLQKETNLPTQDLAQPEADTAENFYCSEAIDFLQFTTPMGLSKLDSISCEYGLHEGKLDSCTVRYVGATEKVEVTASKVMSHSGYFTLTALAILNSDEDKDLEAKYLLRHSDIHVAVRQTGLLNKDYVTEIEQKIVELCGEFTAVSEKKCNFSDFYKDADGDGYGNLDDVVQGCGQVTGYVNNSKDCDDKKPKTNPEAKEIKDKQDNNCDGQIDEGYITQETLDNLKDDDFLLGNKDAPVSIVFFVDLLEPFTKQLYKEIFPVINELYVKEGLAHIVFRDFPLKEIHPDAQKAAEAGECARKQGEYLGMVDKIILQELGNEALNDLVTYGKQLKLDMDLYTKCLLTGEMAAEVQHDLVEGKKFGVTGIPTTFINGKKIEGAQPFSVFEETILNELIE